MLYYKTFKRNKLINVPINMSDIVRILFTCKIIHIDQKEPFPSGKVIFVGLGNNNYECRILYDMKYTDHMELTYGGYFSEDHSGYNAWWTMNYNYSDEYDKTKAYIVENREDGDKLAAFLNFIGGISKLENTIYNKKEQ